MNLVNEKMIRYASQEKSKSISASVSKSASICTSRGDIRHYFDIISREQSAELDQMFASAIHHTATAFSFFSHPCWTAFFQKLRSVWIPPTPATIGSTFLLSTCGNVMNEFFRKIRQSKSMFFSINGATNIQSKQVLNLMECTPQA